MKIALSAICRGHVYALARELGKTKSLAALYCGYPKLMMRREGVPSQLIRSFPWLHASYMAARRLRIIPSGLHRPWVRWDCAAYDRFVARNLIEADIFHGLSCHNLNAGLLAKKRGARYICDRGSSHIIFQNRILQEEGERTGIVVAPIDSEVIEIELAEYAASDRIFVPSLFARRTFAAEGISEAKIWSLPYGVSLDRWRPQAVVADGRFRVAYLGALSLRKGIHDLLEAFRLAKIPGSELVLMGVHGPESESLLMPYRNLPGLKLVGRVPHGQVLEWLARSSVFVLPSIEDGFGLVLAEAQACGVPIVATANTGGPDMIEEGRNGYVVPIRDPTAIAAKLIHLYENPELARAMRQESLQKVRALNGWGAFSEGMLENYHRLLAQPN